MKRNMSHGNLVDSRYYMSDEDTLRQRKGIVKRTKSFWKFGKNGSDNEILEGMALWRHRDLVDVDKKKFNSQERVKRSRDRSNDSDRTINAKQENDKREEKKERRSVREKRREYKRNNDDQFYDDDGDGLMMKTVNRKNILQQYNNDTSGPDSDSDSEMMSDDPYDCILVDDQNKPDNRFPNVAEIGKKLEKLSKTSKFSPNANNQLSNAVAEKNLRNSDLKVPRSDLKLADDIMQYENKRHSFKTFGIESDYPKRTNETNEKRYYESKRYDSEEEDRQFIPRTKLTKTSSNGSKPEDVGLMEYGETLQKRLKNRGDKYDEKSPHNGNMYGPWYDLWGLDASARK